jgi:hypothetical protein
MIGSVADAVGVGIVSKPMIATANAMIDNPLVSIPVSTGLGIVANTALGNPLGGAIDTVTGNAWNLRSDLPNDYAESLYNELVSSGIPADEAKALVEKKMSEPKPPEDNRPIDTNALQKRMFNNGGDRTMTPEEYYRIQNELQKRRNSAMQRARLIEYQQNAMEDYR